MQANWLYISLPSIPAVHAPLSPPSLASTLDSVRFSPHSHALAHRAHSPPQKKPSRESLDPFRTSPRGPVDTTIHPHTLLLQRWREGECALARPATALEGINLSMGRTDEKIYGGYRGREEISAAGAAGEEEGIPRTHTITHTFMNRQPDYRFRPLHRRRRCRHWG